MLIASLSTIAVEELDNIDLAYLTLVDTSFLLCNLGLHNGGS